MTSRDKIKSPAEVLTICDSLRRKKHRVVFTNGCFDLLHVGHIRYLEAARDLGDLLVDGVNSDRSMRMIKGPLRPIIPEEERSELVAALQCVDYVVLFNDPDPLALITLLSPDILAKGADWPLNKIIGAETVQRGGGSVVQIPLIPNSSTSIIIERILDRFSRPARRGSNRLRPSRKT
jgi:rfaE bifunctional protein nucleotidyltransferase chain/domain